MQHSWATTPNTVECYMLRPVAHPVACCCAKFETGQTLSKQLPTFLLLRNRRSVAQQCWIRLHSLRPRTRRITHGLLGVYKILWVVSFPRPLQVPLMLELLRLFARSLTSSSLRTYHSLRLKLPFNYFS